MANYANLKSDIAGVIRTNNNEEITGDILQEQLLGMVDSLGAGYQYKGVATPTTAPGTPDENVFYIASTAGTYTNFGSLVVAEGEVAILKYNGSWAKEVTGAATAAQLTQLAQYILQKADKRLGNNIIDPDYVVSGYLNSRGNVAANDGLHVSGYIPVDSGQSVTIFKKASSSSSILCFAAYDKGLNFVRAVVNNTSYTQQGNEAFVRCTLPAPTASYPTLFANYGASLLAYEPFVSVENAIQNHNNDLLSLDERKLDKVYGVNLIDPAKETFGYLNTIGVVAEPAPGVDIYVSDYIPVTDGQSVQVFKKASASSSILTFAAYDATKQFVRGLSNTASYTQQGDEAYIRITLATPTTEYPTHFANYGTELAEYEPFTDYAPLEQLKKRVDSIDPEKPELTTKVPNYVYCICDDITNFSLNFFADHCVNLGTTKRAKLVFAETGNDHLNLFAPISNDGSTLNGGANALEQVISGTIKGDYADKQISFTLRSILNTYTANTKIRVLCIGDSVTNGTGANNPISMTNGVPWQYWTLMHRLCAMDKANHGGSGYDYLSIGKQSSRAYWYNNVQYKDFAEGRGGWTIANYLFDASVGTINNFFYDGSKTWTGDYADELNAAGVKFSLASYIGKYKTLEDDGSTRLVVGSTAGSEITDINECDVCTPNIIVVQLSHNQNSEAFATNLPLLLKALKNEYPNIPVLVSLLDETGCYNHDIYPMFNPSNLEYTALHEQCMNDIDVCKEMESTFDGVYYCPSNFIQPTAFSIPFRHVDKAETFVNDFATEKLGSLSDYGEFNVRTNVGPNYHPSCIAHSAWAYQMLAMIKWILNPA